MPAKGLTNLTVKIETRKIALEYITKKRKEFKDQMEALAQYTSVPAFVHQAVKEKIERESAKSVRKATKGGTL